MRKIFRMKYEPCSGQCYTADNVLNLHQESLSVLAAGQLLDRIIAIHEPACGNRHLAYGMDLHESTTPTFVASFLHYGKLELFAAPTAIDAMNQLIDAVLEHFDSAEHQYELRSDPAAVLGHKVCAHGEDQDLRRFALKFSGLSEQDQATLLEQRA